MSTRRSFFKHLALGIAAVSSAHILLPKCADAFKWHQPHGKLMYVVNPDYVNAPVEMSLIQSFGTEHSVGYTELRMWTRPAFNIQVPNVTFEDTHKIIHKAQRWYPRRFDASGKIEIPPFIQIRGNPKEYWSI